MFFAGTGKQIALGTDLGLHASPFLVLFGPMRLPLKTTRAITTADSARPNCRVATGFRHLMKCSRKVVAQGEADIERGHKQAVQADADQKKLVVPARWAVIAASFLLANYAAQHGWPLWSIALAGAVSLGAVLACLFAAEAQ